MTTEDAIAKAVSDACEIYMDYLILKHKGQPEFLSIYLHEVLSPIFAPLIKAPDHVLIEMAVVVHGYIDYAEQITRELAKEPSRG